MRIRFTDKEIKEALKHITVLIDTREQKNEQTIKWLEKNKINYKEKKLDYGDYSCYIPRGTLKGIDVDIYLDNKIVIERKQNIDELAGNFSKEDNPRLKSEFAHLKSNGTRVYIFVTDNLFDKHLREGNYRSKYAAKSLYARLKGFEAQYNTIIRPVNVEYFASEMYNTLYYYTRDLLMRNFSLEIGEGE